MKIVNKKIKNFETIYEMVKTVIKFGDIEIEKHKFHPNRSPFLIKNIDINKIVVSIKVSLMRI